MTRERQEREWLAATLAVCGFLKQRAAEVEAALVEFDDPSSDGWHRAADSGGVRTEWRAGDDSSLWFRMVGEFSGAELSHAIGVHVPAARPPRDRRATAARPPAAGVRRGVCGVHLLTAAYTC